MHPQDSLQQDILVRAVCPLGRGNLSNDIVLAHLNLRDEYLPYKYIIGQVLLDVCAHIHILLFRGLMDVVQKNKSIKTVVNKLDSIDAKFRFFKMELLAGDPNYVVEHVGVNAVSYAFASLT